MPLIISGYNLQFLNGSSETAELIRNYNWEETALGTPDTWPDCIRIAISMCLNASFPISICWGKDFNLLYNDAYIEIAGDKHPQILGKARRDAWPENHELVEEQLKTVMEKGVSIHMHDQFTSIKRFDFMEECYFDYTISPIVDVEGKICGVISYIMETTYRILNERRNRLLHQLSVQLYHFHSGAKVFTEALYPLRYATKDIGFALLYRHKRNNSYVLTQSMGIDEGLATQIPWPLADAGSLSDSLLIDIPEPGLGIIYPEGWNEACTKATIIPLKQNDNTIIGILVVGIHPGVRLDESYHHFLESVSIRINTAIINALNTEKEKHTVSLIKQSEDQFQFAIDAADLATWDYNPFTNRFIGNDRLKAWFGLPFESEIELSRATDLIIEKDRLRVLEAIQEALTYRSAGHYDIEYSILNPITNVQRQVKAKGKALFNEQEQAIRFSGTLQDITEERRVNLALEKTNQRLEVAISEDVKARKELDRVYEQARLSIQAARLGTFDMDLRKGTMEWDTRCRELFGLSHDRPVDYERDFLNGLFPGDKERVIAVIDRAFNKTISNGNYDVEYRTVGAEDGKIRWVKAIGKVFFDVKDEPVRFIGSVLEVTEQKEDELRKNDFISMVSHELKTPLTSLKGYIQLLNAKARKEANDFAVNTLDKVELQVKKMTAMINSFLNVSRLESGHIHLTMGAFKLEELLQEVIDESYLIYSSHVISLVPNESLSITGDREKIAQVLTNLISNAVKYSPRGKNVVVAYKQVEEEVQISVSDEGMGIRPQDKDRLFDRFYRVDTHHTQNISGFGIGLYLCAELIHQHHGRIWLESEKGVGSQFFFSLPIDRSSLK